MSYQIDIGTENCMDVTESDVNHFVASLSRGDSVEVSPEIREAVFDQLEYDLSLTLYRFERRHLRNSELLQLIRFAAETNRFSAATYVREAVVADRDRKVTEGYLKKLSERTSHREWFDGPAERRPAQPAPPFAFGRGSGRAELELLAFQH